MELESFAFAHDALDEVQVFGESREGVGGEVGAGKVLDGVFFETHPEPEKSPSDGPNMVPLDALEGVLARVLRIHEARLAGERP